MDKLQGYGSRGGRGHQGQSLAQGWIRVGTKAGQAAPPTSPTRRQNPTGEVTHQSPGEALSACTTHGVQSMDPQNTQGGEEVAEVED